MSTARPKRLKPTLLFQCVFATCVLSAGCTSSTDAKVDVGLADVANARSQKQHYPVIVHADFGADGGPAGLLIYVYGTYSQIDVAPNPEVNGLAADVLTTKLTKTLDLALEKAKAAMDSTPPPKPTVGGPDWNHALHPPAGVFVAQVQMNGKTIVANMTPGQTGSQANSTAGAAAMIVAEAQHQQEDALANAGLPPAFVICSRELVQFRDPNAVDPHLSGPSMLLLPLDRDKALAGLRKAIESTVSRTAGLKSKPTRASMEVNTPLGEVNQDIELTSPEAKSKGIETLVNALGSQIDDINRGSSTPRPASS